MSKNNLSKLNRVNISPIPTSRIICNGTQLEITPEWHSFLVDVENFIKQANSVQEIVKNLYLCRIGSVAFVCGFGNFENIPIGVKPIVKYDNDGLYINENGILSHTGETSFNVSLIVR